MNTLKKLFNIVGLKMTQHDRGKLRFYPYSLDIEPTVRCNLKCSMCQVSDWGREVSELEFDDFRKIVDGNPQLVKVKLQGMGEPLLNKDFFKMVEYASSQNISVHTTTNGLLLEGSNLEKTINSGLRRIYISIDGASDKLYGGIRKGAGFERVKKNVANLVRVRRSSYKGRPEIYIWMVGMSINIHELPDMVELTHRLGADGLFLQRKLSFWGKKEWSERLQGLSLSEVHKGAVALAQERARRLGLKFIDYRGNEFSVEEGKRCLWPWRSAFITADGFVCPCCIATDPRRFNLGNIHIEGFEQIWNNSRYMSLRESIHRDRLFEMCLWCYKEYYAEDKDIAHHNAA